MRLKGQRLLNALIDGIFHVDIRAVLALRRQIADRIGEQRTGLHQFIRQIKHILKAAVTYHQTQLTVIDRQRLPDQVQARACHRLYLLIGNVQLRPPDKICVALELPRV